MKQDEKKIEELLNKNWNNDNPLSQIVSMKQYAEYRVQQERERMLNIFDNYIYDGEGCREMNGDEFRIPRALNRVREQLFEINLINKEDESIR